MASFLLGVVATTIVFTVICLHFAKTIRQLNKELKEYKEPKSWLDDADWWKKH
jgi:hypothetical protein